MEKPTSTAPSAEVDYEHMARRLDEVLAAQDDLNRMLAWVNASLRWRRVLASLQ